MEGPDEQASDSIQAEENSPPPPPPPPPPSSSEVVMMGRGTPSDGDLFNILLEKTFGHDIPTEMYKVMNENAATPDFFEPANNKAYCSNVGSVDEKQQEWYFLIPTEGYRVITKEFTGLTGVWKQREDSVLKYIRQEEDGIGYRTTFDFFCQNPLDIFEQLVTDWRLYEYQIDVPMNINHPAPHQKYSLYRMREGEMSETSSTGSGWGQIRGWEQCQVYRLMME